MNVLVIPEDFRKDQYMLGPIIQAMMTNLGRPRAKVQICRDPLLGGVGEALKKENIRAILDRYRMVQLFLLCVDRDGQAGRRTSLDRLEEDAKTFLEGRNSAFLAENAWQELEVWVLAGHVLLPGWEWKAIRSEVHPKERYFEPLAAGRGLLDEPGGGRRTLAREAASRYGRILQLCPEDVANLQGRIKVTMNL